MKFLKFIKLSLTTLYWNIKIMLTPKDKIGENNE